MYYDQKPCSSCKAFFIEIKKVKTTSLKMTPKYNA